MNHRPQQLYGFRREQPVGIYERILGVWCLPGLPVYLKGITYLALLDIGVGTRVRPGLSGNTVEEQHVCLYDVLYTFLKWRLGRYLGTRTT